MGLKKINKKKLIIAIIIIFLILSIVALFVVYSKNRAFRSFWDEKVLKKNVNEEKLATIKFEDTNSEKIFAYSNYICTIKDNKMTKYNSYGKIESEIDIKVTTPLIASNGTYVAVAEKNGKQIYVINKNEIVWQKELEGNISNISINEKGDVSVILLGTSYKSVIVLYNNEGNEIFKTYLSSTVAVDAVVSNDNKYLSFAEVNISGTLIQSNIKVISVEKAKDNPSDSIIYTYKADANNLIINLKYQNNKLICMYDNSIHVIDNNTDKKIVDLNESGKNIIYSDINLNNNIVRLTEESDTLFASKIKAEIINTNTENKNIYEFNGNVKKIYCDGEKIGINAGTEVHFINTNGWLVKKYTASKEIKDVVMSNSIAGIIYKDKIEVLNI